MAKTFSFLLDSLWSNLATLNDDSRAAGEKNNMYMLWEVFFPQISECMTVENKRVAAWRKRKSEPEALAREILGVDRRSKTAASAPSLAAALLQLLSLDGDDDGNLLALAIDACWPSKLARGESALGALRSTDMAFLFSEEFRDVFWTNMHADFPADGPPFSDANIADLNNWLVSLAKEIDTFHVKDDLLSYLASLMLASLLGPIKMDELFPNGADIPQTALRGPAQRASRSLDAQAKGVRVVPVALRFSNAPELELDKYADMSFSIEAEPFFIAEGSAAYLGSSRWGDAGTSIVIARNASGDTMISREHAVIQQDDSGSWSVVDCGSTNGTAVLLADNTLAYLKKTDRPDMSARLDDGALLFLAPLSRDGKIFADAWTHVFRIEVVGEA